MGMVELKRKKCGKNNYPAEKDGAIIKKKLCRLFF